MRVGRERWIEAERMKVNRKSLRWRKMKRKRNEKYKKNSP